MIKLGKQSVEVAVRAIEVRLRHKGSGKVDELFQSNSAAVVVVDLGQRLVDVALLPYNTERLCIINQ